MRANSNGCVSQERLNTWAMYTCRTGEPIKEGSWRFVFFLYFYINTDELNLPVTQFNTPIIIKFYNWHKARYISLNKKL